MPEEVVFKIRASIDQGDTTWAITEDALVDLQLQYQHKYDQFSQAEAEEIIRLLVRKVFSNPKAPLPYPDEKTVISNEFKLGVLVLGLVVASVKGRRRLVTVASKRELNPRSVKDGMNQFKGLK